MLKLLAIIIPIINLLTIIYMVFKEKRPANSIIAWTLILYIAPIFGFFIFIFIGRRMNNKNMYNLKQEELKMFKKCMKTLKNINPVIKDDIVNSNKDMIMTLESLDFSPYRDGNEVWMYSDGKEFFEELLYSLKSAKKSINIQFYIFKSDEIGTKILNILGEKAKEGVEVRLLYDSVGSRSLNRKFVKKLAKLGVKSGEFFPSVLKYINLNMNFRNHRKIVVIDNKIGFIGGFNVGDEYLGKDKKFGYWRDTHVQIAGNAVTDLNLRFLADWRYATKEDINLGDVLSVPDNHTKLGDKGIQIVSSGPDFSDEYEIKLGYLKMIQKAKKYIYIQSPYLIIDNSISDSLRLAAASNVDVRIMIPGKGDHLFVYWANSFYAGLLLRCGVKVYRYDKNAFLHSKTVVIDDEVCSIGTANMDTRSFQLNFEVNAFIYSCEIAKEQRREFENDILKCEELTLESYKNRSKIVKAKEAISRMLSGVL